MNALLKLSLATRLGVKYPNGTYRSERHFLDFVVNGHSIWQLLGKPDMVSVLCFEYVLDETIKAAKRLVLRERANLPNGRRSLYVCSECGDLGCGAITAVIARHGSTITWKDFGYENTYETEIQLDKYTTVGPFNFDAVAYERTVEEAMDRLKTKEGSHPAM
jgi:hypothetical protein